METYLVFESSYAPEIALFTPAQPTRDLSNGTITPSPTWPRSPPSTIGGQQQNHHAGHRRNPSIATTGAGATTEEATIAQPVKGRGARLSFLGGRKKDHQQQQQGEKHKSDMTNGENGVIHEEEPTPAASAATGNENRRSFFRSQQQRQHASLDSARVASTNGVDAYSPVHGGNPNAANLHDWAAADTAMTGAGSDMYSTTSAGEKQGMRIVESQVQAGQQHQHQHHHSGLMGVGSVRKRLSMLRLGKKSSKGSGGLGLGGVDEE